MKFKPQLYYLSNGMPVILDDMDIETVTASISFFSGGYDETPEEYGITHFCEHMFCKETKRFPTKIARTEFLENNGGFVNAGTSAEYIALYGSIIAKNLGKLIAVLADELNNAKFNQATIDNERGVIIDELHRAKDNSERQMYEYARTTLLGITVPDGRLTLGNEKNLKSFTREQLIKHTHKFVSADNGCICISGKIKNKKVILKQLEKLFGNISNHKVSHKKFKYIPTAFAHDSRKTNNVYINICIPRIYTATYNNICKNMSVFQFERYLTKELMKVLRYDNGLVYGVRTKIIAYGNNRIKIFETQTSPENIGKVTKLIAQTMSRVYNTNPITNQDLQRFRNNDSFDDAKFLESADERSNQLIRYWADFHKLYDLKYEQNIDKNITFKDVIKYTKDYFKLPISILTQGADYKDDIKRIWCDNFKIKRKQPRK